MKCIVGSVSQAKHGWEWAGEGGSFWATTDLKLGQQHVRIYTSAQSEIEDGDRLAVAGTVRRETLKALAYRNLSRGTQGDSGCASSLAVGVFFLALALGTISSAGPFALFTAAIGACLILHAYRTRAAIRALKNAA